MTRSTFVAVFLLAACGNDNALKRANKAPTVVIDAPSEGEIFRQGSGLVVLTATVADSHDPARDLAVTLGVGAAEATPITPDADGGVTVELALDDQPLGALALTLTVVDTDGASATATVTVDIGGPLGAPTVVITTPEEGSVATVGDAVAFRGEATDQTTPSDDLVFVWTSDLDGALAGAVSGDGASALFTETLSVGTHVVTLSATDTDGEVGTDTVTLVVEEEVVIAEPGDLVFSEMMVNPESVEDDFGEWVELYNTSGSAIDITGYSFRDDDVDLQVLEGPLLVAAHDYVVLCANVDPLVNGGVPCDAAFRRISTGGGLALANGEDELVLARPDGTEIDWLHYDETWYTIGVGLGLNPDALDGEVNDDPTYWCNQTTILAPMTEPATPGAPNDACDEF